MSLIFIQELSGSCGYLREVGCTFFQKKILNLVLAATARSCNRTCDIVFHLSGWWSHPLYTCTYGQWRPWCGVSSPLVISVALAVGCFGMEGTCKSVNGLLLQWTELASSFRPSPPPCSPICCYHHRRTEMGVKEVGCPGLSWAALPPLVLWQRQVCLLSLSIQYSLLVMLCKAAGSLPMAFWFAPFREQDLDGFLPSNP
jgi:hypothetical protein